MPVLSLNRKEQTGKSARPTTESRSANSPLAPALRGEGFFDRLSMRSALEAIVQRETETRLGERRGEDRVEVRLIETVQSLKEV